MRKKLVIIFFSMIVASTFVACGSNNDYEATLKSGYGKYITGQSMSKDEYNAVKSFNNWKEKNSSKSYSDWNK